MKIIVTATLVLLLTQLQAQQGWWRGQLHRPDGELVVFTFEVTQANGKQTWFIKNAGERIKVDDIAQKGDSLMIQMPVFESGFHVRVSKDRMEGIWIKGGALKTLILPFTAVRGNRRFDAVGPATMNIDGRWSLQFQKDSVARSIAEFKQSGNYITGTVLNPTGDYRYLEGVVSRDSMWLSSFDGSHTFLFKAKITGDTIVGTQFSGETGRSAWTAVKNASAGISETSVEMKLKPGEDSLHFAFKDTEGKMVSIADKRFRNKVVVVQLMGSWCPNCMDETEFLSEYYKKNKQRGIEIVALAYEYSTDWQRSVNSIRKFQQRFQVQYPVLITGVTVMDSLRTEKTLPELTPIKVFPSAIVIDKKGKVRKLDTGFNGPATGDHYELYKKDFEETINSLLAEK